MKTEAAQDTAKRSIRDTADKTVRMLLKVSSLRDAQSRAHSREQPRDRLKDSRAVRRVTVRDRTDKTVTAEVTDTLSITVAHRQSLRKKVLSSTRAVTDSPVRTDRDITADTDILSTITKTAADKTVRAAVRLNK